MKDLDLANKILGMELIRNKKDKILFLSKESYINKSLKEVWDDWYQANIDSFTSTLQIIKSTMTED